MQGRTRSNALDPKVPNRVYFASIKPPAHPGHGNCLTAGGSLLSKDRSARRMKNRGVYFVANDAIYELAVAFLKSFRIHNPSLPLCLIPYDRETERLSRLSETYNFCVWTDDALFERCAEISRRIHAGKVWGQYRKLAAWHGPFDEFIYIDTDTVVTSGVAFVYDFLKDLTFVFTNSNIPEARRWVWKDKIYATGALTERQIEFAANTGFFCSTKGTLSIDAAESKLADALAIIQHMELRCVEQPFLNYLVVTSGKSHDSLWNIVSRTNATHFPIERWAGSKHRFLRFENCRTPLYNVLLVHWAGEWQVTAREWQLYQFLRKLGYKGRLPTMRLFMRNRRLWRYYRYLPEHLFSSRYCAVAAAHRTPRLMDYAGENDARTQET
jgi:hypothetical protein